MVTFAYLFSCYLLHYDITPPPFNVRMSLRPPLLLTTGALNAPVDGMNGAAQNAEVRSPRVLPAPSPLGHTTRAQKCVKFSDQLSPNSLSSRTSRGDGVDKQRAARVFLPTCLFITIPRVCLKTPRRLTHPTPTCLLKKTWQKKSRDPPTPTCLLKKTWQTV